MFSRINFIAFFASIFLVVWAVTWMTACGGSATETASAEIRTKPQLVRKVEAICRRGTKEKIEGLKEAASRGEGLFESSVEGVEKLVSDVALPSFATVIESLNELQPAPAQQGALEKLITAYEGAMEEAEANPGIVLNNNPFKAGDEVAKAYGVKGCSLGA